MPQAERRKLLLRRRQWQLYRESLLVRGIDYDNPGDRSKAKVHAITRQVTTRRIRGTMR